VELAEPGVGLTPADEHPTVPLMLRLVVLLVSLTAGCGSVSNDRGDARGDAPANNNCVVGSSQVGTCLL